jgi:hypothetical protein
MTQIYKIRRETLTSMTSRLRNLETTIIISLVAIKTDLWAETLLVMGFQFIFNHNMQLTSETLKLTINIIGTMKTNKERETLED